MKKLMSKIKSVAVAALTMGLALGAQAYSVSVDTEIEHGRIVCEWTEAEYGEVVYLSTEAEEGYVCGQPRALGLSTGTQYETTLDDGQTYYFDMPDEDVILKMEVTPVPKLYTINLWAIPEKGGTVTSEPADEASEGTLVTLTVTPNAGYKRASLEVVTTEDETPILVSNDTFTMPNEDVTVKATFVPLVTVTPQTVTGASTVMVFTNGTVEVTGIEGVYTVEPNAAVTVVYKADAGYKFAGGAATWTTNFTASAAAITVTIPESEKPKAEIQSRVYINSDWSGKESGEVVEFDGVVLTNGVNAFAVENAARDSAFTDKTTTFILCYKNVEGDAHGQDGHLGYAGSTVTGPAFAGERFDEAGSDITTSSELVALGTSERVGAYENLFGGYDFQEYADRNVYANSSLVVGTVGSAGIVTGKMLVGGSSIYNATVSVDGKSTVSVTSGTFSDVLIGGCLVKNEYSVAQFSGALNTEVTLSGATVKELCGGCYMLGEAFIDVSGGTAKVTLDNCTVTGNVIGGNSANDPQYSTKDTSTWGGNVDVTIVATNGVTTIGGDLVAGCLGTSRVRGNTSITLTGRGDNLLIGGDITGDSSCGINTASGKLVTGTRTLAFNNFNGTLGSADKKVWCFDAVTLTDSTVTLAGYGILADAGGVASGGVSDWQITDGTLNWTKGENNFSGDQLTLTYSGELNGEWTVFRLSEALTKGWKEFTTDGSGIAKIILKVNGEGTIAAWDDSADAYLGTIAGVDYRFYLDKGECSLKVAKIEVGATVTVTPQTVTGASTYEVFTNDTVKVEGVEGVYTVYSNAAVKVVYTADDGYKFADGATKYTASITADKTEQSVEVPAEKTPAKYLTGVAINETPFGLKVGMTKTLTFTITPTDAATNSVTWSSSDDAVASVDPATGLLTALDAGSATIRVTVTDTVGTTKYSEIAVTVTAAKPAKGDVDGNGISDVLLKYYGDSGVLGYWMNNGGENDWVTTGAPQPAENWYAMKSADLDGNGLADVLMKHNGDEKYVGYYKDGDTTTNGWVTLGSWAREGAEWVDMNVGNLTGNEGRNSIVFLYDNGELVAWLDCAEPLVIDSYLDNDYWSMEGTGDFDGDGKDEVLLQLTKSQDGAEPGFYAVNTNDEFTLLTGITKLGEWKHIVAVGDFDGDGTDDIVVANWKINGIAILGGGRIENFKYLGQYDAANWSLRGAGDFDGDGKDDVLMWSLMGPIGYYSAGDFSKWTYLGFADPWWSFVNGK